MKPPVILRVYKNNQLNEVKQFTIDQIVVGSNLEAQLVLSDDSISPIHCLIEKRDSGYYICDLGSQNGTFKNGQAVLDEPIQSGDEIFVGKFKLVFFIGIPKPVGIPKSQETLDSSAVKTEGIDVVKVQDKQPLSKQTSANDNLIKKTKEIKDSKKSNFNQVSKPQIDKLSPVKSTRKKKRVSFAPPGQIHSLKSYLSPTRGSVIEVNLTWNERVIQSYHFKHKGIVKVGPEQEKQINIPSSSLPLNWPLLEISTTLKVFLPVGSEVELLNLKTSLTEETLFSMGKASKMSQGFQVRLDQGDLLFVNLPDKNLGLCIRFVENTGVVPFAPLLLSSSEIGSIALSVLMSLMLAFYVSTMTSKTQPNPTEIKTTYTAEVLFNEKPKQPKPPEPPTPPELPKIKPPEPEIVKVKASDANREASVKGKIPSQNKAVSNQVAKKAVEVAPIANSQNKLKKFTSLRQGGAVKIGSQAGANAQSDKKDVSKIGLFSAFGSGGVRSKMDQAYQGAGDILGSADKASGSTGFGEDRPGEDLGSKFKDTGRGGKGTATEGISGIGTKGRAGGTSSYGSIDGFGDKTTVAIQAGGSEESFEGSIDKDAVRRRITYNLNLIRGCYNQELNRLDKSGRKSLEGKVVLKWEIVNNGVAKNVRVSSSTLNNREIEKCIAERLATIVFPDPPKDTTAEVMYPFVFRNDK
ncbi:MAG: FHA domain-containing protein [Deltaproteobacteria bacterium]|nr:FHA domain-containing protein [Deltaproteobacteria bacterium]